MTNPPIAEVLAQALLPCPFCGGDAVVECDENLGYWIECGKCVTTGPNHSDQRSATEHWNRRAESKSAPAQEAVAVGPAPLPPEKAAHSEWCAMESLPASGIVVLCHEDDAGERFQCIWNVKSWRRDRATITKDTPPHLIHADAIAWRYQHPMPGETIYVGPALAAPLAQEAVAYRFKHAVGVSQWCYCAIDGLPIGLAQRDGATVEPLYAAPQAREPSVSVAELRELLDFFEWQGPMAWKAKLKALCDRAAKEKTT